MAYEGVWGHAPWEFSSHWQLLFFWSWKMLIMLPSFTGDSVEDISLLYLQHKPYKYNILRLLQVQ